MWMTASRSSTWSRCSSLGPEQNVEGQHVGEALSELEDVTERCSPSLIVRLIDECGVVSELIDAAVARRAGQVVRLIDVRRVAGILIDAAVGGRAGLVVRLVNVRRVVAA